MPVSLSVPKIPGDFRPNVTRCHEKLSTNNTYSFPAVLLAAKISLRDIQVPRGNSHPKNGVVLENPVFFENISGMDAKVLLVGAAIYLGYRANQKVNAANKFSYMIEGIPGISYTRTGGVTFIIPVRIGNNTSETFIIRNIYAKVFGGGSYIGDTNAEGFTIKAFAQTSFTLNLSLSITNTALSLISAIVGKKTGYTLELNGTVSTDLFDVPLSVSKKLF